MWIGCTGLRWMAPESFGVVRFHETEVISHVFSLRRRLENSYNTYKAASENLKIFYLKISFYSMRKCGVTGL